MADTNIKMPDKEELLRQEEALEKKNKAMYPVVITILCLIFAVGFIYGIRLLLNMEGSFPPVPLTEGRTAVPESNEALAAYLNAVVDEAEAEKPKLEREWRLRVAQDDDDNYLIETDGPAAVQDTLLFLAEPGGDDDSADEVISDKIADQSSGFGEDMSGVLLKPALTAADIESFTCDYIYYKCKSCGEEKSEPVEACEVCGSDFPYQKRYRDNYTFTVTLKNDPALLARLFAPGTEEILAMVEPDLEALGYSLTDVNADVTGLTVRFEVNRMTDQLKKLTYRKDVDASATIPLPSDDDPGRTATCSAPLYEETELRFTWPAVELNKRELTLAPGKKDQITAERICDDPKAYQITWTSSDESVVTVDRKGYVKAGKLTGDKPGKATVTASIEFNGKTYSESCDVTVKVSVEYIQLNKHSMKLKTGGTETLIAKVASDNKGFALKKPTVQTVSWFTTDESVATVDENGTVTGVSPGTATVYALSDDMYYRASCEVTVE